MDIKDQVNFYDEYWTFKKQNSLNLRRVVKILDYFVIVKKRNNNPKILDLGCGDGRLTAILGEYGDAHGIELSTKAVETANKLYPQAKFFQGNALDFNIKQNTYDVVVSQEVLEHLEDQEAYLKVCFNALKSGSFLILTTPNKSVLDHMTNGDQWSNQPIENVVTPKQLKKLLKKSNFTILDFDSIILNFGDKGLYKIINNKYIKGLFNKLGLKKFRESLLGKLGYGLHLCILAQKN